MPFACPFRLRTVLPQGMRLLLARHAETSAPDRFHGAESDIGLSEWGARQAELLGQSLKDVAATALYSSAMRRAIDHRRAHRPRVWARARRNPRASRAQIGPLSGLSREEGWATYAASKESWIAGDLEHTHAGGESYADIRRRILPIFAELTGRHRGETDHRRRPWRVDPRGHHHSGVRLSARRLRPDRHRLRLGQRPRLRRHDLDGHVAQPVRRHLAGDGRLREVRVKQPGKADTDPGLRSYEPRRLHQALVPGGPGTTKTQQRAKHAFA